MSNDWSIDKLNNDKPDDNLQPLNSSDSVESDKDEDVIILDEVKLESDNEAEYVMILEEVEEDTKTEPQIKGKESTEDEVILLDSVETGDTTQEPTEQIEQPILLEEETKTVETKESSTVAEEAKVEEKPKVDMAEFKQKIISTEMSGDLPKARDLLNDYLQIEPENEWAKYKLSEITKQISDSCQKTISKLKGLLSVGKIEDIELEYPQIPDSIKGEESFIDFFQAYESVKKSVSYCRQGKIKKAIKGYRRALKMVEGMFWVQEQLSNCIYLLKTKRKKYLKIWLILSITVLLCGVGIFSASFILEEEMYFFVGLGVIGAGPSLFLIGFLTSLLIGSADPQDLNTMKKSSINQESK